MRQYFCECQECGEKHRVIIKEKPYPEIGEVFMCPCDRSCKD